MIDLNKPSMIEVALVQVIGEAIGTVVAMQSEQKMQKLMHENEARRQNEKIRILREAYKKSVF